MAKLAVIGKLISIEDIEGADRIKKATVVCGDAGKWIGVVGLDHQVGELVTVFLQDAILPPGERWAFMEKHHHRVRMSRFKGVPSECVIVPGAPEMPVGTDLTEALGVTKHHKPLPASLGGDAVGAFPSFIPKTDEPNFQTVPELVERLNEDSWCASLKCDGSSCTVWRDADGLHVASRNWELKEFNATGAGNSYWRAARKYDWNGLPSGCALQFEVVGPGIQGNPMGLKDVEGRAFTLYDYLLHRKHGQVQLDATCALIGIPQAPVLFMGEGGYSDPEKLRKLAEVKYPNGRHGEGIVIRDLAHSWSFKVISLLYKEAT
jgi:RNA ligase (TIGR02306 family)